MGSPVRIGLKAIPNSRKYYHLIHKDKSQLLAIISKHIVTIAIIKVNYGRRHKFSTGPV